VPSTARAVPVTGRRVSEKTDLLRQPSAATKDQEHPSAGQGENEKAETVVTHAAAEARAEVIAQAAARALQEEQRRVQAEKRRDRFGAQIQTTAPPHDPSPTLGGVPAAMLADRGSTEFGSAMAGALATGPSENIDGRAGQVSYVEQVRRDSEAEPSQPMFSALPAAPSSQTNSLWRSVCTNLLFGLLRSCQAE